MAKIGFSPESPRQRKGDKGCLIEGEGLWLLNQGVFGTSKGKGATILTATQPLPEGGRCMTMVGFMFIMENVFAIILPETVMYVSALT